MVINLSSQHTILSTWMRELRDITIQQDRLRFRRNLERIGEVAAYEISKTLPYTLSTVQTPLGEADGYAPESQPVVATILRAGLPLQQGLLHYFDAADAAFVAAYRKHSLGKDTFEIAQEYLTAPDLDGRTLIIADPMLATGASLAQALGALLENGTPRAVHIVTVIASTVGISLLERRFPEATIWAGAIDDELTAKGYIVPGLGDAGDLSFGPKKQS